MPNAFPTLPRLLSFRVPSQVTTNAVHENAASLIRQPCRTFVAPDFRVTNSVTKPGAPFLFFLSLSLLLPLVELFLGGFLALPFCLALAQDQQLRPHSMYEPPAASAAKSLADSAQGVAPELLTYGEKTNWEKTGLYADAVAAQSYCLRDRQRL